MMSTLPGWPVSQSAHHDEGGHNDGVSPSRSTPGSANARQAKRLQMRNAGFRGTTVPARKISPTSASSSDWSTTSWLREASDAENVSPAGTRAVSSNNDRRQSGGILQDIGNETVTHRPRKVRQRIPSGLEQTMYRNAPSGPTDAAASPTAPKTSLRQRSVRSKPKVAHRKRSLSAETSKYIEHLESELATTQSQLASAETPSSTRQQTSKMRSLFDMETKQLQQEIAAWEEKYEIRVREEVDRHFTIESGLRARIRNLEQDADEAKVKAQSLEMHVQAKAADLLAAEAANVNLEKRVEIMSDLLASTKVELHTDTSARGRRHIRPKSMLPRFQTASWLATSPDRTPRTQSSSPIRPNFRQPTTPTTNPSNGFPFPESPIREHFSQLDSQSEVTDFASENGSIFSEDSATGDSMTSAEQADGSNSLNPWGLPTNSPSAKAKPARRMRRFGGGSLGPKPLILPQTSHRGYFPPLSAPVLEHSKTMPAFFPSQILARQVEDVLSSGRRRASTIASAVTLPSAPHEDPEGEEDLLDEENLQDSLISLPSPLSFGSGDTTRRSSSLGAVEGRNLMEELDDVHSETIAGSADPPSERSSGRDFLDVAEDAPMCHNETRDMNTITAIDNDAESPTSSLPVILPERPSLPLAAIAAKHVRRSSSVSLPSNQSASMLDRLRHLFGDLWRSPVAIAQYFVRAAQARMQIPRPLLNVQWWLIGVLLGPLAKRHLAMSSSCCRDDEEQLVLRDKPPDGEHEPPEAGQDGTSPISGTISRRGCTSMTSSRHRGGHKKSCVHRRSKHSPWLWIRFSVTLAFAVGVAFKDGPASLMRTTCRCVRKSERQSEVVGSKQPGDHEEDTTSSC